MTQRRRALLGLCAFLLLAPSTVLGAREKPVRDARGASRARVVRPAKVTRPRPERLRSTRLRARSRARARTSVDPVHALRQHIDGLWTNELRRGPSTLMQALQDPKLPKDKIPTLYVSHRESPGRVRARLRRSLGDDVDRITIRRLPARGTHVEGDGSLLYLPNDFVVPGYSAEGQENRFNEQYGWDAHRMVEGMLATGKVELAKGMVDNQLYEIRHYGKVLNANRTWSLTRSQPPFLTQSILAVYRKTGDRQWLRSTLASVTAYHRYWTQNTRRTSTGLSRYYDTGRGLPPEAEAGEFDRDIAAFRAMPEAKSARYFDRARGRLTAHFKKGTRTLRASGVDTSERFGPQGADAHEYNPVDLNSLLYRMEVDMSEMYRELASGPNREDSQRLSSLWQRRALKRQRLVNQLMWDESRGQFFDFKVTTGKQSKYEFATTFTPLATGLATPEQAYRVLKKALPRFETAHGIRTSMKDTGHQWDGGIGWAPFIEDAVMGFRRYQYHPQYGPEFKAAADRISVNYLAMVAREFQRTGHIYEKYDVVRGNSRVKTKFGYSTNQLGFGWTNAAFIRLHDALDAEGRAELSRRL